MKIVRLSTCFGQDPMHVARLIGARNDEIVVVVHDAVPHDEPAHGAQRNDAQPDSTLAYGTQPQGTQADGTQPDATLTYDQERALDAFARATFCVESGCDDDPAAGQP